VSGLIPRPFIDELISRTDIVELIDTRVSLKKAGRNYQACCPFHEEKTPSFSVSPAKQFYYCFGCGASGNAIGFLMAYEHLEFVEAVEALAKSLGLEIPLEKGKGKAPAVDLYEPLQKLRQRYEQALKHSSQAIEYLKSRGLRGETVKKFHIGYAPEETFDKFRGRIIFPIHDRRGRVIGFGGRVMDDRMPKYLNSPDSPVFHKGQVLYGLYEAREAHTTLSQLIVVEGYMDVVMLAQAGISFAVATLGTATTPQHVNQLFQHTPKIIFCFDGDKAGKKAAWRALESTLGMMRDDVEVRFLFLPEGEDPDSLVRKEGKDKFLELLTQAQSLPDFFFQALKAQAEVNTLEGRAKFASLALPYIETIPAEFFRAVLLDKLAEIVHLDKSRLSKLPETMSHKNEKHLKMHRTPMRLAIALLIQYPKLIANIDFDMAGLSLPGSGLLIEMMDLVQRNPHFHAANILEYFRDKPEYALLTKLAMWDHKVPELGVEAEWQGVLDYFQKQQRKEDIEQLLKKANQNSLTEEEKMTLQTLLGRK